VLGVGRWELGKSSCHSNRTQRTMASSWRYHLFKKNRAVLIYGTHESGFLFRKNSAILPLIMQITWHHWQTWTLQLFNDAVSTIKIIYVNIMNREYVKISKVMSHFANAARSVWRKPRQLCRGTQLRCKSRSMNRPCHSSGC
jgi:hypothetical protein